VEPNLKESKGGLRDLNTLFWIARYCYNVHDLDDLVAKKLLTAKELKLFRGCAQFLWSVRCHLHFMAGRAEERLSFDVQQELTLRMRVKASKGLNPIESFMRQYFLVAKDVGDLTAIFCAALEEEQNKKGRLARLPALFRRQQNVHGFIIDYGRLSLSRKDLFERDPVNLIRVFAIADKYKLDIHPNTMREMTRSLNLINPDLRNNEEANQLFLEILTSKKSPERTLRRMNEAGVLGRFITDFGRIVALMQFNMYHHYTADEHLLRAIGILSEIDTGALASEHAISHQLLKQDINRRVLYLAVLLHDIAKGRPEDHSIAGAKIARRLGPRLGFTSEETALTEWLVEHHLVMSDVAQRRDLSDPRTIQDFVAFVQTTENLKHLMVLTVVDIRAVGPGVWNSWKAQLIHELYHEAEAVITAGGSMAKRTVRVAAAQRNLEALLVGWSKAEVKKYLRRHQDAYWLNVDLATQLRHANLLRRPLSQPMIVDFNFDEMRDATELTVVAEDHPGLFARLTGACAVAGLNILDARITTTRDGLAVDTLYVQEFEASGELMQQRMERIVETIYDVMYGKIEPPDNLAPRSFGKKLNAFHLTPKVLINNDLSDHSTVIEVSGIDRPGLLYSLSNDLFEQSVSLVAARVATFGERAVDVFYVTDTLGGKITNGSKRARLTNRLKAIIAEPVSGTTAKKPADKVA
jgi:[protein-PII] uridylyltransferase